jgi:hypothetical protein
MSRNRNLWSVPVVLLSLAMVFLCPGCDGDDNDGGADGLTVMVTPNPVTGVVRGGNKRWDFTVTITNWTEKQVTINGYYGEVLNTDTGCTNDRELHTNRPYTGATIAPGGVYSYEAGFESTCFRTGENIRDYEGVTDDGETLIGSVRIYFR